MAYTLELTESDLKTIRFVGYRYMWSDSLLKICDVGKNEIAEHVAWVLRDHFESDTAGGHSMFPMLNPRSELYEKLTRFVESIV